MEEPFSTWALVELMGHTKISGLVTEHRFGNQSMLRIDVPAVDDVPAFTKIVSVGAIYALNPVTEQSATDFAKELKAKPMDIWDMQHIFDVRIAQLVAAGHLARTAPAQIEEPEEPMTFENF